MSDVTATVSDDSFGTTVVVAEELFTAQTDVFNVPSVPRLGDVGDVDTTSLSNGSVLVYKTNNNKWTSTRTLDLQNLEGGEF